MTLSDLKARMSLRDIMAAVVFFVGVGSWIEAQRGSDKLTEARLSAVERGVQSIGASIDATKAYVELTYSRKDVIKTELEGIRGLVSDTRNDVANLRLTVSGKGETTR